MKLDQSAAEELSRSGRALQWATIAWNSVEVLVTIGLGIAAGSLALVAFGLDSLIEVFASLVIIWHMRSGESGRNVQRNRKALRLVAVAFALLAVFLAIAGVGTLMSGAEPHSSPLGVAYLATTALVMFTLARLKRDLGARLASPPFMAEASMTFLDGCLATAILLALALNLVFAWWWADPLAALLIGTLAAHQALAAKPGPSMAWWSWSSPLLHTGKDNYGHRRWGSPNCSGRC